MKQNNSWDVWEDFFSNTFMLHLHPPCHAWIRWMALAEEICATWNSKIDHSWDLPPQDAIVAILKVFFFFSGFPIQKDTNRHPTSWWLFSWGFNTQVMAVVFQSSIWVMIILSVELDMPFAFWAWLREWRCGKPYKDISRSKLYPRLKTLFYTLLPDDSMKVHQKNYGPGDFQAIWQIAAALRRNLAAKVWIFTAEIILRIMSAPQVDLGICQPETVIQFLGALGNYRFWLEKNSSRERWSCWIFVHYLKSSVHQIIIWIFWWKQLKAHGWKCDLKWNHPTERNGCLRFKEWYVFGLNIWTCGVPSDQIGTDTETMTVSSLPHGWFVQIEKFCAMLTWCVSCGMDLFWISRHFHLRGRGEQ